MIVKVRSLVARVHECVNVPSTREGIEQYRVTLM